MRTKTLLLTALAAAAIAGCASINRLFPHEECDGPSHVCRVTITVNYCKMHDQGSVTATPDVRHVPDGTWVVQWTLATQGHEFADDDGIQIKQPGSIFVKRGKSGAATFLWVDNNTGSAAKGKHPYSVHILKNGAECASYDPDISND